MCWAPLGRWVISFTRFEGVHCFGQKRGSLFDQKKGVHYQPEIANEYSGETVTGLGECLASHFNEFILFFWRTIIYKFLNQNREV